MLNSNPNLNSSGSSSVPIPQENLKLFYPVRPRQSDGHRRIYLSYQVPRYEFSSSPLASHALFGSSITAILVQRSAARRVGRTQNSQINDPENQRDIRCPVRPHSDSVRRLPHSQRFTISMSLQNSCLFIHGHKVHFALAIYRTAARLARAPNHRAIKEVVNPRKAKKLDVVAARHGIDPVVFKTVSRRLLRVWPLLP